MSTGDAQVQIFVTTGDDIKILLATLSKNHPQVAVDLAFSEGESVSFHTQNGSGAVHLAGYFLDDDEFGEEMESEDDEEVPQLVDPTKTKKGKKSQEVTINDVELGDSDEEDVTFDEDVEAESGEEEEDDDEGEFFFFQSCKSILQ